MVRDQLLRAAGELHEAYERVDWSMTPLGPVSGWSPALRSAFEIMAHTEFPCTLLWGEQHTLLYNAAYTSVLGEKHPAALGAGAAEVFPEAWGELLPIAEKVRTTSRAVYLRDALVPLVRGGRLHDAYFTYCYSPVHGADGEVEGVLDIVTETTRTVLAARRLALVDDLREALGEVSSPEQVQIAALAVLNNRSADVETAVITTPRAAFERDVDALTLTTPPGNARVVDIDLRTVSSMARGRVLTLTFSDAVAVDDVLLATIRTIGVLIAHALDRTALLTLERETAVAQRNFSEALQLSLLGEPEQTEGLEVAVCYIAASDEARIGGDWYDSFALPDGALQIAVGDVAGHDRTAAVTMAQARSILRGIAFCSQGTPADMLQALDRAFDGLRIAQCSSLIVGRLDQADDQPAGTTTLHWSNAGHPPPVLVDPRGTVSLLEREPEPLLGLDTGVVRSCHRAHLAPRSTLVLYTDGLIERRGEHLDTGLDRLRRVLDGTHDLSLRNVIDRLRTMAGPQPEDDIAMVVVRTHQTTA